MLTLNFKYTVLLCISIFSFSFFSYSRDIYVNDVSTTGDFWCTAVGSSGGTGTKSAPFSTLKDALASSTATLSNPDVIYVDAGNYYEKNLTLKSNIEIIGAGSALTVFSPSSPGTFLVYFTNISGLSNIKISNIKISGYNNRTSSSGEAITISNSSSVTLKNINFNSSFGAIGESALYINSGSSNIVFDGSSFSCQNVNQSGGGIEISGNNIDVEIKNSLIAGNDKSNPGSNPYGGGIKISGSSTNIVKINNCIFYDNKAKAGGAIHISGGAVSINKCKFEKNSSTYNSGNSEGGGAIYLTGTSSQCNISDCHFKNNSSASQGGAIQVNTSIQDVNLKLQNCLFEDNTSPSKIENGSTVYIATDIYTRRTASKTFVVNVDNCQFKSLGYNIVSGPAQTNTCADGIFNIKNSGIPATKGLDGLDDASCKSIINVDNNPNTSTVSYSFPEYQSCPNAAICNPAIPGTSPTVACPATSVTLTATGPTGSNFTWYEKLANGNESKLGTSTSSSPDFVVSNITGTKTFYVVSDLDNCQKRVPITVNCTNCATLSYTGVLCNLSTVSPTFSSAGVTASNYTCTSATTPNTTTSDLKINNTTGVIDLAASKPGTYVVKCVVTAGTCEPTTTITINPNPVLELSSTSVCNNSVIAVKAWRDNTAPKTNSTPNGTTPWVSDNANVELADSLGTSFTIKKIKGKVSGASSKITYKDINGCTSDVTVSVSPKPVVANFSKSVCSGSEFDTIPVSIATNSNIIPSGTQYTWTVTQPNGITGATSESTPKPSIIQTLTNSTNSSINVVYKVTAISGTATDQCSSSIFDLTVTVKPKPEKPVFTINSQPDCANNGVATVTNFLPPNATYSFVPSTGISIDATLGKITAVSGKYKFVVKKDGCTSDSSLLLTMNKVPNRPYLEISTTSNPLSICAGDTILMKAWTDNTKSTKSTPKNTLPWDTENNKIALKDTANPSSTMIKVIGVVGGTTGGTVETSKITFTDINGCYSDTIIKINTAGIPTTINNATDLKQQFCVSDNAKVSNLKPSGLFWFEEKGKTNLAPTTVLKTQNYYAALQDNTNGCFTKKDDRVKVEVVINQNPSEPTSVDQTQSFCKIDNPEVSELLIPGPVGNYKWFLKSGSTLTPKIATDKLEKSKYQIKYYENGCLSLNGVEVDVDLITVPDPQAPTQKLCANNQVPLTLGGLYDPTITNYYYYDELNNPIFQSQPVAVGEKYKVKQFENGCWSNSITVTIGISNGPTVDPNPYNLTPALCKVDNPTFASIEAKYATLPTTGTIYWYSAQNSSLSNDIPKNITLGGLTNKYWIAVKDADGCFSKKQEVVFSIDPGKKPDLKPIELCKTTNYTSTDLNTANISNPKGILTWYLSETGPVQIPNTVTQNNTQEYWASYKATASDCEGERVKLKIDWLDLNQNVTLSQTSQKFCKSGNKTVDDLNPAPYTDANIAWFENTTSTIPYPVSDPLLEKVYYAAEYKITTAGDYCVNPNRVSVDVKLYSNKVYPVVKESVCSKQNGSIEFINPPAGVTFDWYEQNDPNTLDFTGAKYTKPLEKQSFKIKIKDALGCVEEVSVALPECSDSPIPQILSPNGDNFNNKWVINYSGKYKNVQVRIFNRWGNEVFTSAIPYKDDWDGKSNNEYLPSGTYYYVIDKGNGDPIESGFIEFIK